MAKKELTAEMTATYLCAITGMGQPTIETRNQLTVLKNDKTLIIKTVSQTQKAADFVLNEKGACVLQII